MLNLYIIFQIKDLIEEISLSSTNVKQQHQYNNTTHQLLLLLLSINNYFNEN